jgi:hypothetical protein
MRSSAVLLFASAVHGAARCDSYCTHRCSEFGTALEAFDECSGCTAESVGNHGCFPAASDWGAILAHMSEQQAAEARDLLEIEPDEDDLERDVVEGPAPAPVPPPAAAAAPDAGEPASGAEEAAPAAVTTTVPPATAAPAASEPSDAGGENDSPRLNCTSWRAVKGCHAENGERDPANDKSCDVWVEIGAAGFCECGGGFRAAEVPCTHAMFRCEDMCRAHTAREAAQKQDSAEVAATAPTKQAMAAFTGDAKVCPTAPRLMFTPS